MPYQACGGLLQLSVGCGNPAPNMAASCLRLYSSTLCGRFRMSGRTHAPVSSAMRQERLGIESIADCACEAHVSHRPTHLSRQPLSTSASSPSQPQPAAPLHLSRQPLSTSASRPSPPPPASPSQPQPAAPLNLSQQPLSTSASRPSQPQPAAPLNLSRRPLSTSASRPSPPQPAAPLNLSRQPLSTSASRPSQP